MPCAITIDPTVEGLAVVGNVPTILRVRGTATECRRISVRTSCTSHDPNAPDVADVDPQTGLWEIDLDNDEQCPCPGEAPTPIWIEATCQAGGTCSATELAGTITCAGGPPPPPPECPAVTTQVQPGKCQHDGSRSDTQLVVEFSPPLPAGTAYSVNWTTGVALPSTTSGTVPGGTTLPSLSTPAPYPGTSGAHYPSAHVTVTLPGQPPCPAVLATFTHADSGSGSPGSVQLDACPVTPLCHTVSLQPLQANLGCAPAGGSVPLTFTAQTSPTPAYSGPFEWRVYRRDAGGQYQLINSTTNTATGSDTFADGFLAGDYRVEVVISTSGCPSFAPSDAVEFTVNACDCPALTGALVAVQSQRDPCTFTFTVQVSNPSNLSPLEFVWDYGDGTTETLSTATTAAPWTRTHTYNDVSGLLQVTVMLQASGNCPPWQRSANVQVDCGGRQPPPPPEGDGDPDRDPDRDTDRDPEVEVEVPPSRGGGPPGWLCPLLLVLALLFLAAAVAAFLASCIPPAGPGAFAIGLLTGVVGLVLLAVWALFCGATSCALLRSLRATFLALAAAALVVAVVMFLFLNPCWVALLAIAVLLVIAAILLTGIGQRVGCIP